MTVVTGLLSWCPISKSSHCNPFEKSYCQISSISYTKSKNLNISCLILPLFLPNTFKPDVESRMKMYLEQRRQAMLQLHLSDQQVYCLQKCGLYQRFEVYP